MVMFSVKQKRKLAIALMAVSLVQANISFADDAAGNTDNRSMLAHLYGKIAGFVAQSKHRVDSFFDTRNKESYAKHITRMAEDLEHVERDIMLPLQEAIKQDASADEQYYEIVRKTNAIITELHINLQILVTALKAQQSNKNAKAVIDALKSVQGKVEKRLVNLEKNINELLQMCNQYDPALAAMVCQLQTEFHRVNNANVSPVAVLTGIMHRVRC